MDSDDESEEFDISLNSDSDFEDEYFNNFCHEHQDVAEGATERPVDGVWIYNPRSLESQSAMQIVLCCNTSLLYNGMIPRGLYPTLLAESFRVCGEKFIPELVSSWPREVLDLNCGTLYPWEWHGRFTRTHRHCPGSVSLADLVIKGLLNKRRNSRLTTVILPSNLGERDEDPDVLKKFVRLPMMALKSHQLKTIRGWLTESLSQLYNFDYYCARVPMPKYEVAPETYAPVTICCPAVVEWIGRRPNFEDVLIGLALQARTQFSFQFDSIVFRNAMDLKAVSKMFHLIRDKESVRRIVFSNYSEAIHILYKLTALAPVLSEFPNVQSFLSQFDGLYMTTLISQPNVHLATVTASGLLGRWSQLTELDVSGSLLTGRLTSLLCGLHSSLCKLNLSATGLNGADLDGLAQSCHATTLELLNLDHNDLQQEVAAATRLFQTLSAISVLRTCCASLTLDSALRLAGALEHSQTLSSWSLLQNDMSSLQDLTVFLKRCRNCVRLREVGCKPFELHALFAGLYVHTTGPPPLSTQQEDELAQLAKSLKLNVF